MSRVLGLCVAFVTLVIGSSGLAKPAHAAGSVEAAQRRPWPVTVTVQTIPVLADVRLTFDGVPLRTDSTGQASYTGQHDFSQHSLAVVDTAISTKNRRYAFVRWAGQRDPDQAFRPTVTGLPLRANYTITAAFRVLYPVTARFVDQHSQPVAAGQISAVTIRNEAGRVVELPVDGTTTWLEGSAPSYRKSVLAMSDVSYSLQSIMVGGTNSVDAGRQRFLPGKDATVTFTVAFHDLTITAHDAIFGTAIGDAAIVTGPDGTTRAVPFAADGSATLTDLPQGTYSVDIRGPGGVVLVRRLTLSRDRAVDVTVVGWGGLALTGAAVLLVAVGLLIAGRTRWGRSLRGHLGRLSRRPARTLEPVT